MPQLIGPQSIGRLPVTRVSIEVCHHVSKRL